MSAKYCTVAAAKAHSKDIFPARPLFDMHNINLSDEFAELDAL
ncbi:MAG: hypothetical protein RR244_04200 [Oscillospiraceae bacterium]